jgi:hypothetical protein
MRAIGTPPLSLWDEASMTEPPCEVLSPRTIKGPDMVISDEVSPR